MSNTEDNFDDHERDSSDGEEKKGYESILSNPSYFSATMKVSKNCVLTFACETFFFHVLRLYFTLAYASEKYG